MQTDPIHSNSAAVTIVTDCQPWYAIALVVIMLVAVIVTVRSLWVLWKHKGNIKKERMIRRDLNFFALAVLLAGSICFLLSVADACISCATVTGTAAQFSLFTAYMAGSLRSVALPLAVAGIMSLISITINVPPH